ncbi:MAG TPA: glycosyltransferase family 2 protein [Caldimonas sp.]|nr:glycosyltransferase family 2 protein [Caldimonas sp.]
MIASIISGFLIAATAMLLVPVAVFAVQVAAALRRTPPTALAAGGPRPTTVVLMPAHDEALGIAAAIDTVLPQLRGDDRLLVVADNCSDRTAAIAAQHGAEVVERHDADRRGKGYALDHGVRHLAAAPPAVVIVVDADCAVGPGSIDLLARECARRGRAVQALYLMLAPPGAGLKQRMAEFAWAVRNELRPLGWQRLGGPCQLMGTGMAFPWASIANASLASASIVEDMQLGLDLAAAGSPPSYCAAARVTSGFPAQAAASVAQRTRWEHGHLAMIASRGVPMLWSGLVLANMALVAMALDLCVPPLAALVLSLLGVTAASAVLAAVGGSTASLGLALGGLVVLAVAVAAAWGRVGRRSVSLAELALAPLYALAKIPIYVRLFTARQLRWVRTGRDDGGADAK